MDYEAFKTKFQIRLDPQQQEAVCSTGFPVLLLAVPGSGKTTVLITRLGYLLYCCGVRPDQILTMTYTVAATNDMRRRFCSRFGAEWEGKLAFRTINGVCASILRRYEQMTGGHAFELITDEGKLNGLLGELYHKHTEEFATEPELRELRTKITYIKNQMLSGEELAELKLENGGMLKPIYLDYCAAMRANRWMDFDDQMVYALQILRQYPDLLASFRNKFRYLCVDEAQDTSRIQHCIIRLLAGDGRGLFMVGDEDQSIYGFRAACPDALMQFEDDHPGARVLFLETNYRCSPQIVSLANQFIRQNTARRDKQMRAASPAGLPVQIWRCKDRKAQYHALAQLAADVARGKQTGTTAVLYRDNDSAIPLIDLLQRAGLPYRTRASEGSFFNSRIVRDVTDFLHLALDPKDSYAFLRIYYKMNLSLSKFHAQSAAQRAHQLDGPIWDALDKLELSPWTLGQLRSLRAHFRQMQTDSASRALDRILYEIGYGDYLDRRQLDRGKMTILQLLAEQVQTPTQLLERLSDLQELMREGLGDPSSEFILSTIHSSKGLEYDQVILIDVIDGAFPKGFNMGLLPTPEQLAELEEERRLFYVGMTRARKELSVVAFDHPSLASSFLQALFPQQIKPKQPSFPTAPAAQPASTLLDSARTPDAVSVQEIARFAVGVAVRHQLYGDGVVAKLGDDLIVLRFADGSERRFSLSGALRVHALTLKADG